MGERKMGRKEFMRIIGMGSAGFAMGGCAGLDKLFSGGRETSRPNVLLITVDDLRPALGCYGNRMVKTPNIDRLASQGMVFQRAYCQDSVCSPSRTSMLTGLRPDSTKIFDNSTHFRVYHPDLVTLPQQFKNHGYHTCSMGKVFHSQWDHAYCGRALDDPPSWIEPAWFPDVVRYYFTEEGERVARDIFARTAGCQLHQGGFCIHHRLMDLKDLSQVDPSGGRYDDWVNHFVIGKITEAPDVPDNLLYDGQVAAHAIEQLRRIQNQPFFLAVGFIKPHTPYVAPKKYWDLYDPEQIEPADNPFAPQGAPSFALPESQDHDVYVGTPLDRPVDEDLARHLIHGYFACVSYIDAQVGRLLDELDQLGLSDKTIVVFWGDQGYHLGENSRWGKQTCYEMANRLPLIASVPGMKAAGRETRALVEAVDIYPALCELANLPLPEHLEGFSFAPLLDDADRPWKSAAFSQFPRPVRVSEPHIRPQPEDLMGYSMRTDRYRYVEWRNVLQPDKTVAVELYDHKADPAENLNLVSDSAFTPIVEQLHRQLEAGWRAALPRSHGRP